MSITFSTRTSTDLSAQRKKQVYEGKRKVLFESQDPGAYICHFTDVVHPDLPIVSGKGVINNRISELFFAR